MTPVGSTLSLSQLIIRHQDHNCSCRYGLLDPPEPDLRLPLYLARLAQYRNGDLQFCSCSMGKAARSYYANLTTQISEEATQQARRQAEAAERRHQRIFEDAGVPPRFLPYTLESFRKVAGKDPGKEKALAFAEMYAQNGYVTTLNGERKYGLFLWGESGRGKTGLLSPLFVQMIRAGHSGLWVQYNSLLRELKDFESGQVDDRIRALKLVEYLFIDDFADPMASKVSDYVRDVIAQIIHYRNDHLKSLFLTSNVELSKLVALFGERLVKRLAESCLILQLSGPPLGIMNTKMGV